MEDNPVMPLELCKKCGGLHYSRDPCPIKSTPARKDVHEGDQMDTRPGVRGLYPSSGSNPTQAGSAGTQALPVELINAGMMKRGRGRPQTIFDMKAYKADKERKRRAAAKEGK